MEFLRKHYEKVIFSAVLVGLAVVVAYMLFRIEDERKFLEDKRAGIQAKKRAYTPLNLAAYDAALTRAKQPTKLTLSGPHNVLNPVLWQERPDGTRIKVVTGTEVGPGAAVVANITPLRTIISLEGISGTSYHVGVVREASRNPAERRMVKRYVSTNSPKTDFFALKEVKGPADNPEALILVLSERLSETGETVTIAKDRPFIRNDAYTADLKYDVEGLTFNRLRDGDTVSFGGEDYSVEIKADAVILSAKSSTKRTILKFGKAN